MKKLTGFSRCLLLLSLILLVCLTSVGCGTVRDFAQTYSSELGELGGAIADELLGAAATTTRETAQTDQSDAIDREGSYTARDDVALYLHTYGELPPNFITKAEAQKLGWESSQGNLWEVAPGKSIGGDKFGNYEGLLPKESGRQYYECDIDFEGGYRGAKRIIYSNDGLIYYTEDHYESFTQLY